MLRAAAGSYEGCLFGWHANLSSNVVEQDWGFKATIGAIRCLSLSADGKYLVCGGVDERIHIYDMGTKKSLGELTQHTGAVSGLRFFGNTHLLSCAEDATLCVWRVSDWECIHVMGGHKAAVDDFTIHPSGKLALSVSRDYTMKLWNLVQGRCSFTRRLKGQASHIHFDDDGAAYLTVINNNVHVYRTEDNALVCDVSHRQRVNQAVFLAGGAVLSIGEDKLLKISSRTGVSLVQMDISGLGGRPRDLSLCPGPGEGEFAAVASSSGTLVLLDVARVLQGAGYQDALVASHQVTGEPRLICLVSWHVAPAVEKQTGGSKEGGEGGKKQKKRQEAQVDAETNNSSKKKKKRVRFSEASS